MSTAPLQGDRDISAVYAAHGNELFRFAMRGLSDRGLAEEAVQETFVRVWQANERFDEHLGSMRTWLFAILRNIMIDLRRARASRPRLLSATTTDFGARSGGAPMPMPTSIDLRDDSAIDQLFLVWQVEESLCNISAEHRFALVEVHCKGRSYDDVATELGVAVGTVKSRVYYGLKAVRLAMEELGYFDGE